MCRVQQPGCCPQGQIHTSSVKKSTLKLTVRKVFKLLNDHENDMKCKAQHPGCYPKGQVAGRGQMFYS